MFPNTTKLQLPQWQGSDDMEYTQVNDALLKVENKLTASSFSTALRPTGTERFDGRVILDTTLNQYLRWNASAAEWQVVRHNAAEIPTPTPTIVASPNFSVGGTSFAQRNGIAQVSIIFTTNNALSAGDIGNVPVCTIPSPWTPIIPAAGSAGAQGVPCAYYIGTNGVVNLCATAAAVSAASQLSCIATYIIGN